MNHFGGRFWGSFGPVFSQFLAARGPKSLVLVGSGHQKGSKLRGWKIAPKVDQFLVKKG